MEYRTLELNIISAKDIKNVNIFSKMDVYAVVSLSGDPLHPQAATTHVHKDAGTNPTWNYPVKFSVNQSLAKENRLFLEIKLVSDRTLGDTVIGTLHVPLRELLDNPAHDGSFRQVSYQVMKASGKSKGSLNFSYRFGEPVATPVQAVTGQSKAGHEPVMAYPPSSGAGSASYPPPQQQQQQQHGGGSYGYPYPPQQNYYGGYPPQQSYGYPPQGGGYGYPQQPYGYPQQQQPGYAYPQAQKPKKNKFGMGLGAGLLGGALGGLLIGDMVSDAGGYDAGFDDAGGFDF